MDLDQVRARWEALGRDDPFWAVLSWDGMEHGQWDVERFFAEGEREVACFLEEAEIARAVPAFGDALDFGCGVGRLTRALAARFDRVVGVDISSSMIEQAERLVATELAGCSFRVSSAEGLPFADGSFDLVLSNIVLQHLPPRLARRYVSEFLRVLRPNAVGIFQMAAASTGRSQSGNPVIARAMNALPSGWREELYRRRATEDVRRLPMYGIPRARMLRFVERHGGRVVACIEDQAAGPNWRSFHYIVRRSPITA